MRSLQFQSSLCTDPQFFVLTASASGRRQKHLTALLEPRVNTSPLQLKNEVQRKKYEGYGFKRLLSKYNSGKYPSQQVLALSNDFFQQ